MFNVLYFLSVSTLLLSNTLNVLPGITLDCDGDGQYGMVVTEVSEGGAVAKDGRLKPGDLVLSLNYENLRRVTPAQARAILRRAQLITTDIK